MKFKAGDRVRANRNYQGGIVKGLEGNVLGFSNNHYTVEFDVKFSGGHDGWNGFRGKNGYCYNLKEEMLDITIQRFQEFIGDKFKGKRASVIQNGNTYKLVKSDGTVLYTYIPEKELKRVIDTKDRTEKMYIELFEQAIKEFNNSKE